MTGKEEVLKIVPEFDLHSLGKVVSLRLLRPDAFAFDGTDVYDMEICADYDGGAQEGVAVLRFSMLRSAILPRMSPTFYFGELEIDDVSHEQLEGVRFRVKDHGMETLEILCGGISIQWLQAEGG